MRRDFTMNALMEDVLTGEILDHFGGIEDLKCKVLRHVNDDTFAEDPLRVLRAAQFAARFEFAVAEETINLAKTMDLGALAKERVFEELKKALQKAQKPSIFFETNESAVCLVSGIGAVNGSYAESEIPPGRRCVESYYAGT